MLQIHENLSLVNTRLKRFEDYMIISAAPATGIVYIINNFVSGHVRMRGRGNGAYPYRYLEMIDGIFGKLPASDVIEVCSGTIHEGAFTVDINAQNSPLCVADAQNLKDIVDDESFMRWRCDPPYNEKAAKRMYNMQLPVTMKLLKEGARVVKEGGLLFLLSSQNYQWHPKNTKRIGCILMTIVPNNEIRACNIFLKLEKEEKKKK